MPENPIHILYLEDDEDDSFLFEWAVNKVAINAEIVRVADVPACLNLLDSYFPDIIFLDINIPVINGKECLTLIRKQRQFDKIPIVMFTTSTNETDILDTFRLGANLFLTKPFRQEDLAAFLRRIFSENWQVTLLKTIFESYVL